MTLEIDTILQQQLCQVDLDPVISVERSTSIRNTLQKIQTNSVTVAIVVEDECPIGMLTQRDIMLRIALAELDSSMSVETVMTDRPKTLKLESTLKTTVDLLTMEHRRSLPIVDDAGKIVGVATARAIVNHVAAHFPTAIYNLPPSPNQTSTSPEGA